MEKIKDLQKKLKKVINFRLLIIKLKYKPVVTPWRKLSNIIRWIPVIWQDEDFDYEFLLKVLRFKLTNMEHHFRHYGVTEASEKNADQMKRCILALDRLIEDKVYYDVPDCRDETLYKINQRIEQDYDLIFTAMRRHIRQWWD